MNPRGAILVLALLWPRLQIVHREFPMISALWPVQRLTRFYDPRMTFMTQAHQIYISVEICTYDTHILALPLLLGLRGTKLAIRLLL